MHSVSCEAISSAAFSGVEASPARWQLEHLIPIGCVLRNADFAYCAIPKLSASRQNRVASHGLKMDFIIEVSQFCERRVRLGIKTVQFIPGCRTDFAVVLVQPRNSLL